MPAGLQGDPFTPSGQSQASVSIESLVYLGVALLIALVVLIGVAIGIAYLVRVILRFAQSTNKAVNHLPPGSPSVGEMVAGLDEKQDAANIEFAGFKADVHAQLKTTWEHLSTMRREISGSTEKNFALRSSVEKSLNEMAVAKQEMVTAKQEMTRAKLEMIQAKDDMMDTTSKMNRVISVHEARLKQYEADQKKRDDEAQQG
jgi:hypothetical protein